MRGGITFARLDCKKKIIKEIKTNIIITNQIKSNPGIKQSSPGREIINHAWRGGF
jgi:hypothetical protein